MTRLPPDIVVIALLAAQVTACSGSMPAYQPRATDRKFVVASLQNLADHVGFTGTFSLGSPDTVLVLRGSDLCDIGFIDTMPPAWQRDIRETGFEWMECTDPSGASVREEVKPWPTAYHGARAARATAPAQLRSVRLASGLDMLPGDWLDRGLAEQEASETTAAAPGPASPSPT